MNNNEDRSIDEEKLPSNEPALSLSCLLEALTLADYEALVHQCSPRQPEVERR
jgi:hypothetical protein